MVNNPKKVKDPTEVALSAIQEALNIGDAHAGDIDTGGRHAIAPPVLPSAASFGEYEMDARANTDRPSFEPAEGPHFTRRPANDDRETIGQILQAIQKGRPTRNVYTLATLFAGVWILGAGLLTISFLPSLQTALGQGSAAVPLLAFGLLLGWAAAPGWTELILMYPNRVGGIAATCAAAFRPYSPVLANLAGVWYCVGWVPALGLAALRQASALQHW